MADRVLFIAWDQPVRGREERALEVFDEAVGYYGRLQQEGRIEGFDVVFLAPSGGLDGYIQLHGATQQLAVLREDETFQRILVDASLVVDGLRLVDGFANAGIAERLELYRNAIGKVPQAH